MKLYEFDCEVCKKHCVKKIPPKREQNPPKFCSNACKFKSMVDPSIMQEHSCGFCGTKFVRYTPPSMLKAHKILYCDKVCAGKAARQAKGDRLRSVVTYNCEYCKKDFEHLERANGKPYKFCSRQCAQREIAPGNRGYEALYNKWVLEHSEETAKTMLLEHAQKRSDATKGENNPCFGKQLTDETKQKISTSCTGIPNVLKGKTFEEFYGPEKGKELADQHSDKLREGFRNGKLKPVFSRKGKPTVYKGTRLRSQLERKAIEFLEKRDGLELGTTLLYEDPATCVQWYDNEGKSHTYFPDLHDLVNKVVYEVKPQRLVETEDDTLKKKREACQDAGHSYSYITEHDLRQAPVL